MSDTVTIFGPSAGLVSIDDLQDVLTIDAIGEARDAVDNLVGYRVGWADGTTLSIQIIVDEEREDRVNAFQLLTDDLLGGRKDKKARKIWRRAERMVSAIDCTVEPDWDEERKAQTVVQAVMEDFDYALMLAGGTIYNENGNIEIGHKNSKPKYWVDEEEIEIETGPAAERKQRSIEQLKSENVPTIKHLSVIPDESLTTIRSLDDVAQRALCLYLISRRAEGESYQWFQDKVAQYRLQEAVTADEWEFAEDEQPPEYVLIKFSRRLEGYWCLLWALGYVSDLNKPTAFAAEKYASEVIETRSWDQFLLEATLRDKTTILDQADLYYRYSWAVLDAELYGRKPPSGIEPDVVYERHYALNWLRRYNDQDWDDVTTDT